MDDPQTGVGPGRGEGTRVPSELLERLHTHARGAACEAEVWAAILARLGHPLPDDIAHDLIERGVAVDALGHSRQSDLVQRRLASFHPEALLTLGVELFTDASRSAAEVRELLQGVPDSHPGWQWLLEALVRRAPSDAAKARALDEAASRHPDPEALARLRDVLRMAARAAEPDLTPQEARALRAAGEEHVWLALAANPATPTDVLRSLAASSGHKLARQIRLAAKRRLAVTGRGSIS